MNAPVLQTSAPATSRVLTFDLGGEVFAIPASSVREILEVPSVTYVPGAPDFNNKLINVRGAVVPLANLRIPFGMADQTSDEDTRVIVIEEQIDEGSEIIGIMADKVTDVYEMNCVTIDVAPTIGSQWRPEFIHGIGRKSEKFVIIINMVRIIQEYMPK